MSYLEASAVVRHIYQHYRASWLISRSLIAFSTANTCGTVGIADSSNLKLLGRLIKILGLTNRRRSQVKNVKVFFSNLKTQTAVFRILAAFYTMDTAAT